jgi:hypothetical protein
MNGVLGNWSPAQSDHATICWSGLIDFKAEFSSTLKPGDCSAHLRIGNPPAPASLKRVLFLKTDFDWSIE